MMQCTFSPQTKPTNNPNEVRGGAGGTDGKWFGEMRQLMNSSKSGIISSFRNNMETHNECDRHCVESWGALLHMGEWLPGACPARYF